MEQALNGASRGGRESKDINLNDQILKEVDDKIKSEDYLQANSSTITLTQLLEQKGNTFDWLLEGLIQRVGMGTIAGTSDIGKSTIMRQLALDITASKEQFLAFKLHTVHCKAILVYTEDLQDAIAHSTIKQIAGKPVDQYSSLRFIFDFENLIEKLDKELTRDPADIIVVDCFADSFGGDLKDTQHIRKFLAPYQKLVSKHQCFLMFVHHTGKRTENLEPSKNNLLSGQGLEAKMRLVLEIRGDEADPYTRHLCVVKGNYLSNATKRESYVLHFDEESLTFSDTGERTAFGDLIKTNDDYKKETYYKARTLRDQGLALEKIATEIGYSGKGAVSKMLAKGEKLGWNSIPGLKTNGNL